MEISKEEHEDLFDKLPRAVSIDILSRLPPFAILQCKVVCKEWLDVVRTEEFGRLQQFRAKPHLIVSEDRRVNVYKIFDTDEVSMNFKVKLPDYIKSNWICGSVNGLIWMLDLEEHVFICNPMTHQITRLPDFDVEFPRTLHGIKNWGFGVNRNGGEYKFVRMVRETYQYYGYGSSISNHPRYKYEVYTMGNGSWRSFEGEGGPIPSHKKMGTCIESPICTFANGNLHWLEYGPDWRLSICCFDLETEAFTPQSPPPRLYGRGSRNLAALGDRLCLCDNTSTYEVAIWLLDQGVWTKEYVIDKSNKRFISTNVFPIKVYKDGDDQMILIGEGEDSSLFTVNKSTTFIDKYTCLFHSGKKPSYSTSSFLYTPSFIPLKT